MLCSFAVFLKTQFSREDILFLRRKKFGFGGSAGQKKIRDDASYDGRNALQNQQPSPTTDPKPVGTIKNHP
jgi:hypothetical protein